MSTPYRKPAAVAAKWWADRLRKPARQDNGTHGMDAMLITAVSLFSKQPDMDQVSTFERKLDDLVEQAMIADLARRAAVSAELVEGMCVTLATDYGTEGLLYDAAKHAGIKGTCPPFPMKTVMWVYVHKVQVRYGYGRNVETLWSAEQEATPHKP